MTENATIHRTMMKSQKLNGHYNNDKKVNLRTSSATWPEWSSFCETKWKKKAGMEDGLSRPKKMSQLHFVLIDV